MNKAISNLTAALAVTLSASAFAADEFNVSRGITTAGVPLGLHGVDAVALTSIHDVSEGSALHTVVVDDVAYYFASAQNAGKFESTPEKYLPQYGGYCAYAVALGRKFDGDPRYADIVDGKLYLFVNEEIYHEYKKDAQQIRAKADRTWPSIEHKAVEDL